MEFLQLMRGLLSALLLALLPPLTAHPSPPTPHVVVLGDSNTWLGGDDCTGRRGWTTWFRQRLSPASCRSYARSGATWTCTPQTHRNTGENIGVLGDDNVIYNQICRLTEAVADGQQPVPHLIIIMAGTNDAWFHGKRPQAFEPHRPHTPHSPKELLTLCDAVYDGCLMLHQSFPSAQMLLVTPMPSTAVPDSLITKAGDIIETTARKLAATDSTFCHNTISVFRLDRNAGFTSDSERTKHHYTYDGTHTNEAGAQRIGTLIANHLKNHP